MTSIDPRESADALPITGKKRDEDWVLVLIAEGMQSKVVRVEAGFTIRVAPEDEFRARETSWRIERVERARRLALQPARGATPIEDCRISEAGG